MIKETPPSEYEDFIRVVHERYDSMSKTHQKIVVYITQNPNDVAVQSVNAMGGQCEVHASSFVRFAQSLGYKGFKELQAVFRQRLTIAAPGFEARVKALDQDLGKQGKHSVLRDLVVRDIASLQDMISGIPEKSLLQAAHLIEKADTIYLLGQLRSAPVVELLRYVLTMLGQKTIILDASGGLATHMSRIVGSNDLLFAVSFRFYATEVVNIVEEVAKRKIPIIAISDSSLSPLAKSASVFFSVPEHEYTFSRSLAAPMCLAQAITLTLASLLQEENVGPRIPTVTQE